MKVKRFIYLCILLLWSFLSLGFIFNLIRGTYSVYRAYAKITEDEKLQSIDGEFYVFMKFCQVRIPAYASCLFLGSRQGYAKIVGEDKADFFLKQHKEKSAYYLYPILVFSEEKRDLDFSYVIVFNGNLSLPGFDLFAQYSPTGYILKKRD